MKLSNIKPEFVGVPLTPKQQVTLDSQLEKLATKGVLTEAKAVAISEGATNLALSLGGKVVSPNSFAGRLARQGFVLTSDGPKRKELTPEGKAKRLESLAKQMAALKAAA